MTAPPARRTIFADDRHYPTNSWKPCKAKPGAQRTGTHGWRCRTLLTLFYHDADDAVAYDEVARRLDMPLGSVGPTCARCSGKLRKPLEA